MKSILGIFTLIICLIATYVFVSYKIVSPTYLPYMNNAEVRWSTFYSEIKVREIEKGLDTFLEENQKINHSIEQAGGLDRVASGYIPKLSDPQVRIHTALEGEDALIVTGSLNGQHACLVLYFAFDKNENKLVYTSKPISNAHFFVSYLANQCNQKQTLDVKRADLFEFINFSILKCFKDCDVKTGTYFYTSSTDLDALTLSIKQRLKEDEFKYYQLDRPIEEIDVDVKSYIGSKTESFMTFDYVNPKVGKLPGIARFDRKLGEATLKSIANPDTLSRYFFR